MTIDFTKPLQTISGENVEIITLKGRGKYPILGFVGEFEHICSWDNKGIFYDKNRPHNNLMNVPPQKISGFINIFRDAHTDELTCDDELFATRIKADRSYKEFHVRIACIKIEYAEGQFDE